MPIDIKALKTKLAANGQELALRAEWEKVCDKIQTHLLAQKPKPRSFEVHHFCERARAAFLETYLATDDMAAAHREGLFKVGLW